MLLFVVHLILKATHSNEHNFVDRKVKLAVFVHFATEVFGDVVVASDMLLLTVLLIK